MFLHFEIKLMYSKQAQLLLEMLLPCKYWKENYLEKYLVWSFYSF